MNPLVTVVIPAYEAERFLAEAIESVLAQTYAPVEVIVVDDGSTDGTPEVVAAFPGVRAFRQENAGQATAKNRGIAEARGELLAFLDADDLMPPDRLERQVSYLQAHPEADCVLGRQTLRIEPGVEPPAWVAKAGDPERPDLVPAGAMVARREVFAAVGRFDPVYRFSEDVEWLTRARDLGARVDLTDDVVLVRRIHGTNLTYDTASSQREVMMALKGRAARRRAGS